jgi:hypothetical protein
MIRGWALRRVSFIHGPLAANEKESFRFRRSKRPLDCMPAREGSET